MKVLQSSIFRAICAIGPDDYYFLKKNLDLWSRLASLEKLHNEQIKKMETLDRLVHGCAYRTTSVRALAEALPEFAHYLPSEPTPKKQLPVTIGIVDEFKNAGWPKK